MTSEHLYFQIVIRMTYDKTAVGTDTLYVAISQKPEVNVRTILLAHRKLTFCSLHSTSDL
jgi:hypothetical protein